MIANSSMQRIARLTPLGTVLALMKSRVAAMRQEKCALARALGCVLAEDVVTAERPAYAIALRDGFAVEASAIADAGPYAPVAFASLPPHIDAGEPLPDVADAVMPHDAVNQRGGHVEAVAPVAPGEGALVAGGDCGPRTPLRRAGEQLRAIDIAVMAAAGVADVTIRSPRVRIVVGGAARSTLIDAARDILCRAVLVAGGRVLDSRDDEKQFDEALTASEADAVIAVGGTGSGRRDAAVQTLARLGCVEAHGIAVSPGETAAFGFVGTRPVLLIPGRIDATLAIWLLIGRHLVARLAGGSVEETAMPLALKRKVTSTIGLAELIPVRRDGNMAEPLASGYLSFESLTRSDGWIVIPADREGYQAGTQVAVRSWP